MNFRADLHVHSRFAYATSPNTNLTTMATWAALKGVHVLGTGDFTHPEWLREISKHLTPAEPGLFRLKRQFQEQANLPPTCWQPTRFILQVEVSTVYRKNDRTRKVYHCIYVP